MKGTTKEIEYREKKRLYRLNRSEEEKEKINARRRELRKLRKENK